MLSWCCVFQIGIWKRYTSWNVHRAYDYLFLSFLGMAIDTQDLSVDDIFTKSLSHSLHNIVTAMYDVFLFAIPRLDVSVVITSPKLLPPGEYAMDDVPFPRRKVSSASLRKCIYVGVIDGHKSGIVLRHLEVRPRSICSRSRDVELSDELLVDARVRKPVHGDVVVMAAHGHRLLIGGATVTDRSLCL